MSGDRYVTEADLEARLRGLVRLGKVRAIDDSGESQTAAVTVLNGESRTEVDIMQPYGASSVPPGGGGAMMVVLAVGGDQGDLVGFPVAAPGGRMGGLAEGESILYGAQGQRVLCRADGAVEILAATKVYLSGRTTEIEAAQAVTVKAPAVRLEGKTWVIGDLHVSGNITYGGTCTQGSPPPGDPPAPTR